MIDVDADPQIGQHFLETFGRDLQLAVNMFVEHGPSSFADSTQTLSSPTKTNQSQSNSNIATNGIPSHNSPEVRAPISQKVECLRPETFVRQPIVFKRKLTVFDGQSPSNGSSSASEESAAIKKRRTLAELFCPPAHLLLTAATLEDARSQALDLHRHLLVSIHNEREFACFALVRDVWNHHAIQEIVGANFALVQFGLESAEGARFFRLYNVPVNTWPFVAVIDPRTGELLASIAGTHDPESFLERLSDIISSDRLSDLSDEHRSPVTQAGSDLSAVASASVPSSSATASASQSAPAAVASKSPVPLDRNELATRRLRFLESQSYVPSSPPASPPTPTAPLLATPAAAAVTRHSVDLRGPLASSTAPSECANIIVRLPDATRLHLLAHRLQSLQVQKTYCSVLSTVQCTVLVYCTNMHSKQ